MIFHAVAVGDSVMWGQGLQDAAKGHRLGVLQIASALGVPSYDVRIVHLARSGANLVGPDGGLPTDDEPAGRELPWGRPSVRAQLDQAVQQLGAGVTPEDVRLVAICGGSNDVGTFAVLTGEQTLGKDALIAGIRSAMHDDMSDTLDHARTLFPRAVLAVWGYYPPMSRQSAEEGIHTAAALVHLALGWFYGTNLDVARVRGELFHAQQLDTLRQAVTEAHANPEMRGPGIVFVHPAIGVQHSITTNGSLLFEPTPANPAEFFADPWGNMLTLSANDPVAPTRIPLCDTVALPSSWTSQAQARYRDVICRFASLFHPDAVGAGRYALAMAQAFERFHAPSVRALTELDPTGVSVRAGLERYGLLDRVTGLQDAYQHLVVDSIRVGIDTGAEGIPPGVDARVYLELGPGRRWRLEDPYQHDDFEADSSHDYLLDPAEGDPEQRLRLSEIEEVKLVLQSDVPVKWEPAAIRLALNGYEVFAATVGTVLEVAAGKVELTVPGYPVG